MIGAAKVGRAGGGAAAASAFAVLIGALTGASTVRAQPGAPQSSLRDMLFGAHPRDDRSMSLPLVAHYRGEMGAGFVFERPLAGPALLKFEDSPEVWVLRPTAAAHGDVIYRDDVGQPMLRASRVGGLTLFTDARPDGMAAWMAGAAPLLRPMSAPGPAQLFQIMVQASARATRAALHQVAFEAPDVTPDSAPVFADAALLTAEAFVEVAGRGRRPRAGLTRYTRVLFTAGRAPQAVTKGAEVRIIVVPGDGVAGRPSSHRIALVIAGR